jgi:hypothetical protein
MPSRTQEVELQYLVVDDTDGRILAELSSVRDALQLLADLDPSQRISIAKLDSGGSTLVHHDSIVAVRPLFPKPPTSPQDPPS